MKENVKNNNQPPLILKTPPSKKIYPNMHTDKQRQTQNPHTGNAQAHVQMKPIIENIYFQQSYDVISF